MKKRVLCIAAVFFSAVLVNAQELTVNYRVVYNTQSPDLFAEAGLSEEMRSSLAKAYKDVVMTYRLTYIAGESDFRAIPPKEKQEIVFMGQKINPFAELEKGKQNYIYKNHRDSLVLNLTTVFGKDFVIREELLPEPYDIVEGEVKEILGYECRKAVSKDGKKTVWFAVHIPIANEPFVCGMDGLVLEYDDGKQLYTATEILDTVAREIVRPDEQQAVSAKEFSEMIQRRVERMRR